MSWFSRKKPAVQANARVLEDCLHPFARSVWDALTAEERVVFMSRMAQADDPPRLLGDDGTTRPLCNATLLVVVESALVMSPAQYAAIDRRISAQFAQAQAEHEARGGA